MTARKQPLGSDLGKVDAHQIQPHEYDEAPEWTEADFARADEYQGNTLVRRGRGRPKLDTPKRLVSVRLDADALEQMRATGPGWQSRVNEAVVEWLARRR